MIKMIDNISSFKSALVSIMSAVSGTILNFTNLGIDQMLERGAWIVAMLAGIVSIVNSCRKWFKKKKDEKDNH